MLSSIDLPIPISKLLLVELVTFELEYPLIKGAPAMIYVNMARSEGSLKRIIKVLDKKTGQTIKGFPKFSF